MVDTNKGGPLVVVLLTKEVVVVVVVVRLGGLGSDVVVVGVMRDDAVLFTVASVNIIQFK